MTKSPLQADLCILVSSVLGKQVTYEASRALEPAWDSLKHMEIIFAVESKYGVIFSEEEMVSISSISDLHRLLENRNAS